jgi:hypothetical protein
MLIGTTMTVEQFEDDVDAIFDEADQALEERLHGSDSAKESQPPELDGKPPELITKAPELSEEDKADRLWWDKVEVLGRIKDCSRLIQETESEIDGYQDQIKEAKEVLKGQQALLNRYSSQLADIMDGHPLPRNPNAPAEPSVAGETGFESDSGQPQGGNWRDMATRDLLSGIKGLGSKKLDAICELAPTVGALETLRGDASRAHKLFKEVLPKGCGEAMADEIENRLVEKVRYDDEESLEDSFDS